MLTVASDVEIREIREALHEFKDWFHGGDNVMMANGQAKGLPDALIKVPAISEAIKEIEGIRRLKAKHLMVNRMPPGCKVPVHRDYMEDKKLAWYERWHLPIATNPKAFYYDEVEGWGTSIHLQEGVWAGPIPYWMFHKVENLGDTERVHLVVDLLANEVQGKYL